VAVTIDQLKFPAGRLDVEVFWPRRKRETVEQHTTRTDAYLTAFLAQGVAKTADLAAGAAQDAATIKWATAQGLRAVYNRLIGSPSSVQIEEEGSSAYLLSQITAFLDQAEALEAEVEAVLEEEGDVEGPPEVGDTRSSRVRFSW
jgi:hypothetical protein